MALTPDEIIDLETAQDLGYSSARFHNVRKNFPLGSNAYAGVIHAVRRTLDAFYSVDDPEEPKTVEYVYGVIDRCLKGFSESVEYERNFKTLQVEEAEASVQRAKERLRKAQKALRKFEKNYGSADRNYTHDKTQEV